jgi:ABC-type sugar transport system substrate-binding protein
MKKCSTCGATKIINVNIASATTTLAPQVAATLIADPKINYIFAGPGDFEPDIAEAIRQAHAVGKVHVFYEDCQGPGTTSLITDKITVGCETTGSAFSGWAAVDSILRILDKSPGFSTAETYPFYTFTNSNPPPGGVNYEGTPGYQAVYQKLWGLS